MIGTKLHISIDYFVEVLRLSLIVQQSSNVSLISISSEEHLKRTSYPPLKQIQHFPGSRILGVSDSSFPRVDMR